MKKTPLIFSSVLLAISSSALAVENGTDVDSTTYEPMNYLVNLQNSEGEKCGGQIIAGQWLLTARHCTTSWDSDGDDDTSNDLAVTGDTVSLTIYQGVGGINGYGDGNSRIVYDGEGELYTFGAETEVEESLESKFEDSDIESNFNDILYYLDSEGNQITTSYSSLLYDFSAPNDADVALIKLSEPIAYQTTLKVGSASEPEYMDDFVPDSIKDIDDFLDAQTPNDNMELTFYGWGRDENDNTVSIMQQGTMTVSESAIYSSVCLFLVYFTDGEYETVSCENYDDIFQLDDIDHISPLLKLKFKDNIELTGDLVNSGDSGTGLIYDGTVYAVASSVLLTSNFSTFTPMIEWIEETVGTLNVPRKIELPSDNTEDELTIPVQNLSSEDIALSIAVLEGNVTIDSSDCPAILEPLESCDATISIYDTSEHESFSFQFNDEVTTTVRYVSEYTGTYSDGTVYEDGVLVSDSSDSDESTSSSSGSSGGSLGLFGLLGMIGLAFSRRKCKAGK